MENLETKAYNYYHGTLSGQEKQAFERWMEESEDNKREAEALRRVYELSSGAFERDISFDASAAYRKFKSRLKPAVEAENFQKGGWMNKRLISRMAAAVVLIIFSVFVFRFFLGTQETFRATDSISKVELPDGSQVWLNKGSSISFNSRFSDREIKLDGEAYFNVVKNATPFQVITKYTVTEVLGTEFLLEENSDGGTFLVVVSGRVAFSPGRKSGEKVLLTANESAEFQPKDNSINKWKQADLNQLAWKTGQLVYDKAPLSKVLEDISDLHDVEVVYSDGGVATCHFSGEFDNLDLKQMQDILSYSLDLQFSEEEGRIKVSGEPCK